MSHAVAILSILCALDALELDPVDPVDPVDTATSSWLRGLPAAALYDSRKKVEHARLYGWNPQSSVFRSLFDW